MGLFLYGSAIRGFFGSRRYLLQARGCFLPSYVPKKHVFINLLLIVLSIGILQQISNLFFIVLMIVYATRFGSVKRLPGFSLPKYNLVTESL